MFPSDEELLDAISEVVTGIESETLIAVFEHWMERLECVSKNNGDYYSSTTSWLIYFSPNLPGTELLNLNGTPYTSLHRAVSEQ
jgi:hypothetical protein